MIKLRGRTEFWYRNIKNSVNLSHLYGLECLSKRFFNHSLCPSCFLCPTNIQYWSLWFINKWEVLALAEKEKFSIISCKADLIDWGDCLNVIRLEKSRKLAVSHFLLSIEFTINCNYVIAYFALIFSLFNKDNTLS